MMPDLKLPLGSRCIKHLMFAFNLFFVITGIILVSIGASIHALYSDHPHFLDDKFLSVPSLLIAIGSIIFFVAFFGCCGAVRENYCMVLTFTSLMVVIFILELAGGISGYVLRNDARELISRDLNKTMKSYNKSEELTVVWDSLQQNFKCCGINGPRDWINETAVPKNNSVPVTCCRDTPGARGSKPCTLDQNGTTLYLTGCLDSFGGYVKDHAVELGVAGLAIAFIQFVGIFLSIYLARAIKMNYETM